MASSTIKAWQYTNGYPNTLKLNTISCPNSNEVQPGHVLVKIQACALNPVDIQMMNQPQWNLPYGNYQDPKGTVMDFSGTVIAGDDKGQFKPGDDIFGLTLMPFGEPANGSLAEIAHFNTATLCAVPKPQSWSHSQAAAISLVWLTAQACISAVAPWVSKTTSKRVAILGGSSATGIYSILLAKRQGWKVISTSSSRNKDFILNTLSADQHVDYTTQDVRRSVSAFQPDAVIDCVGGTECIGIPGTRRYISIVGDKTGRTMMGGPATYYDWLHPYHMATQWFRWAKGQVGLSESYDVVILAPRQDWLEEAKRALSPDQIFIDSEYSFEDAKQAFERLNTGRAKGKVVIKQR